MILIKGVYSQNKIIGVKQVLITSNIYNMFKKGCQRLKTAASLRRGRCGGRCSWHERDAFVHSPLCPSFSCFLFASISSKYAARACGAQLLSPFFLLPPPPSFSSLLLLLSSFPLTTKQVAPAALPSFSFFLLPLLLYVLASLVPPPACWCAPAARNFFLLPPPFFPLSSSFSPPFLS